MRRERLVVVLMGLAFCVLALTAGADDYYIDPVSGSDTTGDGSEGSPWKTLTYANSMTEKTGTEENPVVLHPLAGVYSPSTNGETFPVEFKQGNTYPNGSSVPHFGILAGAGPEVTILDAERTHYVLRTSGYKITVTDLTVTGGGGIDRHHGRGGMRALISAITGSNGSLAIERCVFRDNIDGYGLQVFDHGPVRITDCEFTGNIGPDNGHGAAMRFALFQGVRMTNCLIANNSAYPGYYRSGVYFDPGYNTLINCTIVDNDDVGVYACGTASNARLRLYNCVIWGHQDDIQINGDMPVEIYNCNISDGDGLGENGNISEDPLFVTGPLGDYYLSHADVNAHSLHSQMGYHPQINHELPTANCQQPTANDGKETKMTRATLPVLLLAVTLASVIPMDATGTDWYVDAVNGSNTNGGTSWEDAWKTLTYATSQTNNTGTEEDPCILHAGPGVYSASTNGETFPVNFNHAWINQYASFIGAGPHATILDAEGSALVFKASGCCVSVSDITVTNGIGAMQLSCGSCSVGSKPLTVERCVMKNSQGPDAVNCVTAPATYYFTDCEITDNTRAHVTGSNRGGAVKCDWFSTLRMTNCLVANNTMEDPEQDGGGITLEAHSGVTLTNCTIVGNQPNGIYSHSTPEFTDITLYDCILWDNEDDIGLSSGDLEDIYYCDIEDGDGAGSNGNISEDPLFVSASGGNQYLSHYETEGEDSPCIDAGDRPSSDLGLDKYTTCTDGRPDTGTVDMGYHYTTGPELSDPTHAPDSGRSDVDFTFTVHYYSPAGSEPSSIEVFVNGTAHGMSLQSGDAANGIYSWTGTIPEDGQATYHFEATDSMAQDVRLPASGELDGPMVYDDYVKPQSSCSAPSMTNSSAIDVDYTSSDDNSGVTQVALWMQFDGHGYYDSGHSSTDPDGSFAVALGSGNGTYDFYTIATDRATNQEDAPGSPDATVVFDDTPPTSSASCQGSSNSSPIDVDFTASDSLTGLDETALWYRYEGGSWTDSGQTLTGDAGTFSFALSDGEGTYEFYTVSTDVAGNDEAPPAEADCSVFYDCTAPVSSCDCSPWVNVREWIYVWFTASDNLAGLDSITLWYRPLPSGSWTEYDTVDGEASGGFSFDLPGGVNDVELYTTATDNAGNVEAPPAEADCDMGYDGVKPDSECSSPAMTNDSTMPVDFTASDDRSGVASTTLLFKYEDGGWATTGLDPEPGTSGQFPFTAYFGDGTYYFATRALDNAGNQQDFPAEADCETVLDTTAPVSSCSVDVECTSAATISVQYSASDALSDVALVRLFVSRDGSAWDDTGLESNEASGEFTYDFAGLDGTYRLVVVATDGAGNVEPILAARACTVVYDTAVPSSTCMAPEVENDPTFEVGFEITDALSGAYGVKLYVCFSTVATAACTGDWEYTGEYEYGTAGSITYEPPYGAGIYRFFTIAHDKAGNVEAMKDTADCATDYNPDYALSTCWGPSEASSATLAIVYAADVGQAGLEHVELWYAFSADGADWPDEWLDSGVTSDATDGTLVFETLHGDGYYRFCTIALNDDLLAEPFPSACDCEVAVDATVPSSSVSGPSITGSLPVTLYYDASDLVEEGRFLSGVESVELWYSFDGEQVLEAVFEGTPATIASDSVEFAPSEEGTYELWSIAVDGFGNREAAPQEPDLMLTVDLTPPISSVSAPAYSQSFPLMVSAVATDAITEVTGVSMYYSLDGGDWVLAGQIDASQGTLAFTPDEPLEGVYGFVSVATDLAGHEEAMRDAPDTEATVDWTAPDASVSAPQYANASPIALDYEASDGLAGVAEVNLYHLVPGADEWTQAGLSSAEPDGTFNYEPADGQGEYGFAVVADDLAGNTSELPPAPHAATIYDTAAPTSGASSPTYSKTGTVQVTYSASDPTSGIASVALWYQHDGGVWVDSGLTLSGQTGEFAFDAPSNGTYGFATLAMDSAANAEALPGVVDSSTVVDTVAPAASCDSTELTRRFPIAVTFTASDVTSGVSSVELWYRYDSGSWTDSGLESEETSGSFDFFPLEHPDGVYEFAARARDRAGNSEALPGDADSETLVDTVPPASTCSCPSEVRTFPVGVTYIASDESSGLASVSLWYQFNGGGWLDTGLSSSSSSGAFDFTPADEQEGVYGFVTKGRDVVGNTESLPETPDCIVDVVFSAPEIHVEPASVDFGDVRLGRTVSQELAISNQGDGELEVSRIREQAVGFSLSFGALEPPFPLAPGHSVSFNIEFVPRSARLYEGELTIESNDRETPVMTIDMTGTGRAPTGLNLAVASDADTYGFGDTIAVTVAAENDGNGVVADVYLALAYDLGGPEEVFWSAVGFDSWQDGIVAWLPGAFLHADLSIEATLFDMRIPEYVLGQPRAGQYTVLLAAFEPDTLNLIGNLASTTFDVESNAFFEVLLSSSECSFGDTLSIGLCVSIRGETLYGDFYLVMMDPVGQLWSVTGDYSWGIGLLPWLSDVHIPGGLETTLEDFWQLRLPESPFDKLGSYLFLTAPTERGTLTPLCDIGITALSISQ